MQRSVLTAIFVAYKMQTKLQANVSAIFFEIMPTNSFAIFFASYDYSFTSCYSSKVGRGGGGGAQMAFG